MKHQKKPSRVKLNKNQIQKNIDDDFKRKWAYIIPHDGTVEFAPPLEHPLNRMLAHNKPMVKVDAEGKFSQTGELGHLNFYHIPETKYKAVVALLNEFNMPEQMHPDLIWAFLNMAFASCEATFSTNFYEELHWKKEMFQALDMLEEFVQNKLLLRGVVFEYHERLEGTNERGVPNFGNLKSRKFKGHIAAQFIQRVLQNYEATKDYEIVKMSYDHRQQYGESDMFMGHKNAEKHSQSYYSSVIFDYLRQYLFNSAFDLLGDHAKYVGEVKRLKKLYSRRKMFLFIGKLMILSGLLKVRPTSLNEDIIENIEKKLLSKLRANKRHLQSIHDKNLKSKDGWVEITPFHEFF
ncbi:MAG: hypothetical protein IPG01_04140 [Chitinophagaceae bacterium]|nr:hypothetical protein [Chitinophagaceae bacterium]